MEKLRSILISAMAVVTLGLAAPCLPVQAAATDEVTQIVTEMIDSQTAIFAEDSDDLMVLSGRFQQYADGVRKAASELDVISASDGLMEKIDGIRAELDKMASEADLISDALLAGDETAYQDAYANFEKVYSALMVASDAYDQYLQDNPLDSGDTTYALWYTLLIISLVCLAAAIIVAVITRKQQGAIVGKNGRETTLKNVRRNVVIGAAVFVVGAAIPAAQYWMLVHSETGTGDYYILYYPLIIGAFLFLFSLVQYLATYTKLHKSGGLVHADNAAEMASIRVPKIGEKTKQK